MSEDTSRLDIAVIIPSMAKYGGAERVVVECLRRWQARHRITLYATEINEELLHEHGINDDVQLVRLHPYFEGEHALLLNGTLLPRLWREQIGQHQIYHGHLWPTHLVDLEPMVWYPNEPLRLLHDLRYEQKHGGSGKSHAHIYPKYDYDLLAQDYFDSYLSVINAVDHSVQPLRVVAVSKFAAENLGDVYKRDISDIVYPGVDLPQHAGLLKDPNLFVTISQLWGHKRVRLLIEALVLVDNAQLIIIGSGPDKQWLEELCDNLGVSDRVFIFSGLSNEEVRLLLARAGAFLFAAIREPFGIVVLEAMAAGLPVIAVNEGGFTAVCTDETAFLVAPLPAAFAEKMRLVQADAGLRQRMGAAGRKAAAAYSWQRTADELEAILLETARLHTAADTPSMGHKAPPLTLFGAHYYVWYAEGFGHDHWGDDPVHGQVTDRPVLGYYGSTQGETINAHIDQFETMGLDYIVLNLHIDANGPNELELRSIKHFFEIVAARQSTLRIAIQLAPYTENVAHIVQLLSDLQRRFFAHANYLQLDGKPVLFWFWSGAFDQQKSSLSQFKLATEGLVNIAMGLRAPNGEREAAFTADLFEGFAPYSPLEMASPDNWLAAWNMAYRAADAAQMRYRVASVSPGYDDLALVDPRRFANPRRVVDRKSGDTYRQSLSWLATLDPAPHLALITTFNEYHENTHIEASAKNGDLYVQLTQEAIEHLRRKGEPQ